MLEEDKSLRTIEHSIPFDVLNDVLTRFVILVPEDARENLIRICFQIELAHWFFLDFYVGSDERCRSCTITEFAAHAFQQIPSLKSHLPRLNEILAEWKEYKQNVPTYGAIILSEGLTHVLLVQSYWAKQSWGFPKGKVNQEEDPAHCAVREVFEETGFDITPYLNPDDFLESIIHDQLVRLYVIKNVPLSTPFKPRTRCEIKACNWFAIANLPTNRKDSTPKQKIGMNSNAFFMVLPFIKRIKHICNGYSFTKGHRDKSTSLSENEGTASKGKVKGKNDGSEGRSARKRDRKHTKRQLFAAEDEEVDFSAPSWLNFKFNKMAILECLR